MANLKNRRGGKVSKKNMKKLGGPVPELAVIDPDVAGIDIGSRSHFVAVPADRSETPVREFGSFTANVYEMVEWLKACRIRKVAMESTGVYWIPVYDILEMAGFDVTLVNARHVKNVSGRKSDVLDCQWIPQLHSFGLLKGAFRPKREIVAFRTLVRDAGQSGAGPEPPDPADPEGVYGDEHAASERALGHRGGERDGNHADDHRGRTRSEEAGSVVRRSGAGDGRGGGGSLSGRVVAGADHGDDVRLGDL